MSSQVVVELMRARGAGKEGGDRGATRQHTNILGQDWDSNAEVEGQRGGYDRGGQCFLFAIFFSSRLTYHMRSEISPKLVDVCLPNDLRT